MTYIPGQPWPEERTLICSQRWLARVPVADIAAELGITIPAIANRMARLGLKRPEFDWPEERKAIFRQLRAEGKSNREIAAAIGIERTNVSKWAKRLGCPPKTVAKWSKEDIERCKEKWLAGWSVSRIANELNLSVGQVSGCMFRLGIKHPNAPIRRTPEEAKARKLEQDARRRPRRRKQPISRRANNGNVFLFKSPKPKPPTFEEANAADLSIPWDQRQTVLTIDETECRWPVGDPAKPDFFFCGAPKREGRPYCGAHCERAYERGADNLTRMVIDFSGRLLADELIPPKSTAGMGAVNVRRKFA